jgi:Fe-S cluster assembly protein SufD
MFLYIPPHTEVTEPLQFSLIADDNQGALFPHLLVVVDEGSSITLVDHSTAANGEAPAFVSGIVEIFARSSSRINYLSVQDYGSMSWNFTLKRAILSADSQILWAEIGLGSRVSRVGVEVVLREPGANAQLMGIYFGRDGQHLEYDTLQLHEAPHAKSDLLYKGALKDKARSVFHGLIRVNPGAQGTDAYQANRNLLLSNQARANSLPTLEIEANDVRCTHGATVGPIDPEQLFYLMGRGIDRQLAERLLVLGFFNQVLQHIPLEYVRERVQEHIEQQMK